MSLTAGCMTVPFNGGLKKNTTFWKGSVKERPRKIMKPTVLDPVQKVVLLSAFPCPIIPASAPAQLASRANSFAKLVMKI